MFNDNELYCPYKLQFDTFSIALESKVRQLEKVGQMIKVESQFLKPIMIFTLRLSRYQLCP